MKGSLLLGTVVLAVIGAGVIVEASTQRRTARPTLESLEGRPQVGLLHLARGGASARFTVTALSPPTRTYDVLVETSDVADLRVSIHTWYGTSLRVQGATVATNASNCHVTGSERSCRSHFPELANERAGPWTIFASKQSGPPVTARISVTFARASDGDE